MNIFIMILVFVFMTGYYLIDSPGQRVGDESIRAAMRNTDVHSVLDCVARAHSSAMELDSAGKVNTMQTLEYDNLSCVEKYNVKSIKLCADERRIVSACAPQRTGKAIGNFIVTIANTPDDKDANLVLKTLAKDYGAAPNFGLVVASDERAFAIVSGNGHRRQIPNSIANAANLQNGQIIFITQYSLLSSANRETAEQYVEDITCLFGEQKVWRFNKWECMTPSPVEICTGDKIWDSNTETCEMDVSRRPLCGGNQTAVEVDDLWMCIDPTPTRVCPDGTMASLDYITMEWYCSVPSESSARQGKCRDVIIAKRPAVGGTLLKPTSLCNDCERMIIDKNTCNAVCVPDETKLRNSACYPQASQCRGAARAFYFGFPADEKYLANATEFLPALNDVEIHLDGMHSQNRKFNCLDCGAGGRIDNHRSLPPFVAVCE
jgi:hypothetical protein